MFNIVKKGSNELPSTYIMIIMCYVILQEEPLGFDRKNGFKDALQGRTEVERSPES